MATVKVAYKCPCMDKEQEVEVTARPPNGNLVVWTQHVVGGTISVAHRAEYPKCRETHMEYVKLPVSESTGTIGGKSPHH